jgi:hypothetical protein
MRGIVVGLGLMVVLGACAPDNRLPESSYQWERRQERIEREWREGQTQSPAVTPTPTSTNGAPAPKDRF